jgi:hypothetical protein
MEFYGNFLKMQREMKLCKEKIIFRGSGRPARLFGRTGRGAIGGNSFFETGHLCRSTLILQISVKQPLAAILQ